MGSGDPIFNRKRAKKIRIICMIRINGAEDETRTRDPDLGKVVLYQLSYFRICKELSPRLGSAKVMIKVYKTSFYSIILIYFLSEFLSDFNRFIAI